MITNFFKITVTLVEYTFFASVVQVIGRIDLWNQNLLVSRFLLFRLRLLVYVFTLKYMKKPPFKVAF